MIILSGGVDDPQVLALLDLHVTRARAETAPEAITHWMPRD